MSAEPSTTEPVEIPAGFVARHLRRNFVVLATDYGFFGLGMTFASQSTILPAFAERLGASNLLIGAIPSVMTLGYTLPPLFFANYTERLSRKLRFILTYTIWERAPLLALAGAAYFLAERSPGLAIVALLLALAAISGVGGALMPAWMDLIGKVIPTDYRGRLFAFGSTFAAGLGLGGAVLAGYYLEAFRFPDNYALCFATGFACLAVSFVFLALTVEPEVRSGKPHVPLGTYLRRLPVILSKDRNFTWYLVSRSVGVLGATANGFYTVFALRELGAPEWQVARFTFVLLAAQTIANVAFGYVADRLGHKPVLLIGSAAVALGNAVALGVGSVEGIYLVFACVAVGMAAIAVSALNMSLEFAPLADRPTYIGLASTLMAPVAFASPLLGGFLADSAGYRAVFAVAGLFAVLSLVLMLGRVRDPRKAPRGAETALPAG